MRPATWLGTVAALVALLASACNASPGATTMRLRHEPETVLRFVAEQMNVSLRDEVARPAIRLESETSLERFQEAVGPQWGFRPPRFANAYVVATNEIYLIDEASYYLRVRRTPDESLAHEYAHFIQVHYLAGDLAEPAYEDDAVAVQSRFREHLADGVTLPAMLASDEPRSVATVPARTGRARRMLDATRVRGERMGAWVRYAGGAIRANDARTLGRAAWVWVRTRAGRA